MKTPKDSRSFVIDYLGVHHILEVMMEMVSRDHMLIELQIQLCDVVDQVRTTMWLQQHGKLELVQYVIDHHASTNGYRFRNRWMLALIEVSLKVSDFEQIYRLKSKYDFTMSILSAFY